MPVGAWGRSPLWRFLLVTCLVLIYSAIAQEGGGLNAFESPEYHFTLQYPAKWYRNPTDRRFYIENFPPTKAVRAVRLPMDGGAAILVLTSEQVLPKGARPMGLDEWVALAIRNSPTSEKRTLQIAGANGLIAAVETTSECCAVPPLQESVDWYFEIDGRFFDASVTYWRGDPNAKKLRETLQQVVQTLRVIPSAGRD